MSGTTSIDDLPISPQTDGNIKMELHEKNVRIDNVRIDNVRIDNPSKELKNVRDNGNGIGTNEMNSLITGIQKASASGVLSLPARDIPQYQNHITQDNQTQANYVPKGPDDYIKEHQTPEDIIQKNLKREESENSLDEYYNEIHIPLMIGVLYFIFHLPVVRKNIFKYIPALFNADGNLNGTGYIANSLMFSGLCYATFRSINYMSV